MTAADPALEHNSTHARVHLDSPAGGWPERLHTTGRDPSYTFRAELGLPTDRPIVLSGHQPGLWHAGIAAKVFAADTLAATYHAHAAWLVIDLDNNDPFAMELPVRTGDHRLERVAWRCASGVPSASVPAHQPARRCVAPPPLSPERSEHGPVLSEIAERLRRALRALDRAADDSPSAAVQFTRAALDLLPRADDAPPMTIITASALARTTLFAQLLDAMRSDPAGAHAAYNAAVTRAPDAGVRLLSNPSPDRGPELPIWVLEPSGQRRPAHAEDLHAGIADDDHANVTHAPRGMLTTALVRLAGCDLFLHGTGGRAYEPINDDWFGAWPATHEMIPQSKHTPTRLAPYAIATGDLLLDLGGPPVTEAHANRAVWRAQHARHHPSLLGDDRAQHTRDALVSRIAAATPRSEARAVLFSKLHSTLHASRTEHADALAALGERAEDARAAHAERDLRTDRTWSIALHDPERLAGFRDQIALALRDQHAGAAYRDA